MVRISKLFKGFAFAISFLGLCLVSILSFNLSPSGEINQNVSQALSENISLDNDFNDYDYFIATDEKGNDIKENNIFLYSDVNSSVNFSLKTNSPIVSSPVFQYVYFADSDIAIYEDNVKNNNTNSFSFSFFTISNIILHANDSTTNLIPENSCITTFQETPTDPSFTGTSNKPQLLDLTLSTRTSGTDIINITEPGIYTLSITGNVITASDGELELSAVNWQSHSLSIIYKFFVIAESSYYANSRPIVTTSSVETLTLSSDYDNYYFYNYSNSTVTSDNKTVATLPTFAYDPTRYNITVRRTDPDELETIVKVTFDKLTEQYVLTGDDDVLMARIEKTTDFYGDPVYSCVLTFNNLGEYDISFEFVYISDFIDSTTNDYIYYNLPSLTGNNRRLYIYGAQSVFTDYGAGKDETTNSYNYREFKDINQATSTYSESADITAEYLAYYNRLGENATYNIRSILSFINSTGITPVQTDQSPLKFLSNTDLKSESLVYCTSQDSTFAPSAFSIKVNGEDTTLYQKSYTGKSFSNKGIYIFIIAYSYDKYQTSAGYDSSTKYQVFFLEINKNSPTITIRNDKNGETMAGNSYTNGTVTLINDYFDDLFNSEVIIKLYGYDYTRNNMIITDSTSGVQLNGAKFTALDLDNDGEITLVDNAYYVVEIYNGVDGEKGDPVKTTSFYIDNYQITGLTARNIQSIANSQSYNIKDNVDTFTNQSIIFSWNEKASQVETYAYYKKFSIDDIVYYSDEITAILGVTLTSSSIPVNFTLNMDNSKAKWNKYYGNTSSFTSICPTEYKLADTGLYIFQVFDKAGNSAIEMFVIDNSTPLFTLYNPSTRRYSFPSSTETISTTQTLHWGQYKSIYISNLDASSFDIFSSMSNTQMSDEDIYDYISKNNLTLYKDNNGNFDINICKEFYNKFYYNKNYIQQIDFGGINPESPSDLETYSGYYLSIPNEEVSWIATPTNPTFTKYDKYNIVIDTEAEGKSDSYEILIRNKSNTLLDATNKDKTDKIQYTSYYSNYITLIVTKDAAEMKITYLSNVSNTNIPLASNDSTTTTFTHGEGANEKVYEVRNAYLKPTSMEKAFTISYIPRIEYNGKVTQVESVWMYYYELKPVSIDKTITVNGQEQTVTYWYYTYDKEKPTDSYQLYNMNSSVTQLDEDGRASHLINPQEGITKAGVYVFERTYCLDEEYYFEENDYAKRTITFYVDRDSVISDSITTQNGTIESVVGGDIFLGVYDDGANTNLMLTFPDAPFGNIKGNTLYSSEGLSDTVEPTTVKLTTNKLPVNIYIPAHKYTINVDYTENTLNNNTSYDFSVNDNSLLNTKYTELDSNGNEYVSYIEEYELYAIITYTNTSGRVITYTTDAGIDQSGFLRFCDSNGNILTNIGTGEAGAGIGEYVVTIYQGYYSIDGENSFKSCIRFKFDITSTTPDFDIFDARGSSLSEFENNYYTNQDELVVIWNDPTDEYTAKIDKERIAVTTSTGYGYLGAGYDYYDSSLIETRNNQNTLRLKLSDLNGAYSEGESLTVTMFFEGSSNYYKSTSKTVIVDKTAPNKNINTLVENSLSALNANRITKITASDLREFYDISSNEATAGNESYNVSATLGNYAYYSYSVTSDFVGTLYDTLAAGATNPTSTQEIYYRSFAYYGTDGQIEIDEETGIPVSTKYNELYPTETAYTDFATSQSSLTNLARVTKEEFMDSLIYNMYYEIIEKDIAGNLSIYTVFIYNDNAINEDSQQNYNNIVSYSNNTQAAVNYTINDLLQGNTNIYSTTGFSISNLNWYGDAWKQFNVTYYNSTEKAYVTLYLMSSPRLKSGTYYDLSKNDGSTIELASLFRNFASTQNKNYISFANRYTGNTTNIYITIWENRLSPTISSIENLEFIEIAQPTDAQLATNQMLAQIFATSMKIEFYYEGQGYQEVYFASNLFGRYSGWTQTLQVELSNLAGVTRWTVNPTNLVNNQRVRYTIVDNFGNTITRVHLYNEFTNYKDIDSVYNLYSYYENSELIYLTRDSFRYTFNTSKYAVTIYDENNNLYYDSLSGEVETNVTDNPYLTYNTIRQLTISHIDRTPAKIIRYWNENYRIELRELSDLNKVVETIKFRLYNYLPVQINNQSDRANYQYYFYFTDTNGNIITEDLFSGVSYFSEITFYSYGDLSALDFPYTYYLSRDNGQSFEPLTNGQTIVCDSTSMQQFILEIRYDRNPNYTDYILEFDYISENFYLSSTLSTFYYITKTTSGNNFEIVPLSGTTYTYGKTSYSRHYIVNLDYTQRDLINIVVNEEQNVEIMNNKAPVYTQIPDASGVYTDIWYISNENSLSDRDNLSKFSAFIAITYIAPSDNIARLYYLNSDGVNELLNNTYSATIVANEEQETYDTLRLSWSKYYGISQNKINITISKDGVDLNPAIYEDNNYYYVLIKRSGTYKVQLSDSVGNLQTFNSGSTGQTQSLTIIFLKDIPFTVTYTNPLTQETETTEPINHAIYNGSVTLTVPYSTLSAYYTTSGYPVISVTRNGRAYSDYVINNSRNAWTFNSTGYYSVTFEATSLSTGEIIRKETYNFTIINSEESRYSYEFTKYSNYFIQSVYKMINNEYVDITNELLSTLSYNTIQTNGNTYFSELVLTYLDEKTGSGRYIITVNTNEALYDIESPMTTFTFMLWINVGSTPIQVSLAEGKTTTGKISVSYNPSIIYNEVGESYIRVISYTSANDGTYYVHHNYEINANSLSATNSYEINEVGTFYVQLLTSSGNLLYSYKVVRKEPLNTYAIISIVIAAIILVVVIFLVWRLRKKVSVK